MHTPKSNAHLREAPVGELLHPHVPAAPRRSLALDATRYGAALAIVAFHTFVDSAWGSIQEIGRFAVHFFAVTAMVLMFRSIRRAPQTRWRDYAQKRFQRLYIPFLAWSFIYIIFYQLRYIFSTGSPVLTPYLDLQLLIFGTAPHLWFMPFILISSIILFPLSRLVSVHPRLHLILTPLLFSIGLLFSSIPFPADNSFAAWIGWGSWRALPAIFWGAALGAALTPAVEQALSSKILRISSWLIFFFFMTVVVVDGNHRFLENAIGFTLFCAVSNPSSANNEDKNPETNWWLTLMAQLGAYSFGLYLNHMIFMAILRAIFTHILHLSGWWVDILVWVGASIIGTLLTMWIARTRSARWLLAS